MVYNIIQILMKVLTCLLNVCCVINILLHIQSNKEALVANEMIENNETTLLSC